ncbi:AraC family transcriptional regulator [Paenibacillus oenotherae]|uniref:AraC family transcriptional regulator n=1 Tax=Paenibacillus oenotherae TaxID=1435645 RepID=A0ABS7D6B0_9BACL|nr:AraC family transcriptional regulator [Paenibacillus oenotherae]MBW7475474.1 AraC family transcriptional regulator [Paenibacillus oenotherae]
MELATTGRLHYPGLHHVMRCEPRTVREGSLGFGSRYRLLLVEQGTGLIEVNGRIYPLTAPAVYCLNETSTLDIANCAQLMTKSVYFQPDIINSRFTFDNLSHTEVLHGSDSQDLWCLIPFREHTPTFYGCIPIDTVMTRHISMVLEATADLLENQNDEFWPCRSRSYLLELLFLISRTYKQTSASPELPLTALDESVRPIIAYLHTNYRHKIMLEDLTKQFHTNKTTLNNRFRAATGQSVMAYLGGIRMQSAASLLRNTLLPVNEIVFMVGMNDDAHFIRSFRNHAGCTPAEYRGLHCWLLSR